jgi:hypothetical protein
MFAYLIFSEFFGNLRRHSRIFFAGQHAATYSLIDAIFKRWNTLLDFSGYSTNVQIGEKLVPCTWRKLRFSSWNDRTKNTGVTFPANQVLA